MKTNGYKLATNKFKLLINRFAHQMREILEIVVKGATHSDTEFDTLYGQVAFDGRVWS